jgi:hypothetical protein
MERTGPILPRKKDGKDKKKGMKRTGTILRKKDGTKDGKDRHNPASSRHNPSNPSILDDRPREP